MRKEFSKKTRLETFQRAKGNCEECGGRLSIGKFHYDHIIPDGLNGLNDLGNCAVVCVNCHREKTRGDNGRIAKAKRVYAKHVGARQSRNPLPGGKTSSWKRKLSGEWVRRYQ